MKSRLLFSLTLLAFLFGFFGLVAADVHAQLPGGSATVPPGGSATVPPGGSATVPSGNSTINLPNPIGCTDPNNGSGLLCVAKNIINALKIIAIPIVAIMVLVGGFQIMTAAGNPEKISSGRKTILYAAIGFAVVVLAQAVVSIINSIIGK